MHFYGDYAHTELGRDLLVHHSGRDEADDLLFSRCQRLETGSYFANRFVLGAALTVAVERNLNRIEEILFPERLGEEFKAPAFMA